MALDTTKLSDSLFDAFSKNTVLTKSASDELKTKCDLVADAIDAFVKSADVLIDVYPDIPVAVKTTGTAAAQAGTGATTAVGKGAATEIF